VPHRFLRSAIALGYRMGNELVISICPRAGAGSWVASRSIARSLIHCSSVIGLSEITYLPVTCSSCQASQHDERLLCSGRHEDLHRIVVIANRALVERALDALIRGFFADL
jgi:hypothetical protein